MTATGAPIDRILERLKGVKKTDNGWDANCPAHDDSKPSLGVAVGKDGKVLLNCRSQHCEAKRIVEAIGLTEQDLFQSNGTHNGTGKRSSIVATYQYRDGFEQVLYEVVRFEPKDFRQRKPDGRGGYEWKLNGVPRVPYRFPELLADVTEPIWIFEGEKDVERAREDGLTATTNAGGAGNWKTLHAESMRDAFSGRVVFIVPDNDKAGRDHAQDVARRLHGIAKLIKIVELIGLPEKGDYSDWRANGEDRGTLLDLADAALEWTPGSDSSDNQQTESADAPEADAPPPPEFPEPIPASKLQRIDPDELWIILGLLARHNITMISALFKAGKTTFVSRLIQALVDALKDSRDFCGRPVKKSTVWIVTEEHESKWADRRDTLNFTDDVMFSIRPFMAKPEFDKWLRFLIWMRERLAARPVDVVVLDTLSNLWPVRNENDAGEVQAAVMPLRMLCDKSAVLLVHHTTKAGGLEHTGARGSGALAAFVDILLELRRVKQDDLTDRRRKLSGVGRYDETPADLTIELTEDGYVSSATVIPPEPTPEQRKQDQQAAREAAENARLLDAVDTLSKDPLTCSLTAIRAAARLSSDALNRVLYRLRESLEVFDSAITRANGSKQSVKSIRRRKRSGSKTEPQADFFTVEPEPGQPGQPGFSEPVPHGENRGGQSPPIGGICPPGPGTGSAANLDSSEDGPADSIRPNHEE